MDIQNKEALIAEIEQFKEEALKMHIVQVLADSYTNTNLFDYNIDSDSSVIWYKAQARQLWDFWQAKAQAVPKWISVEEALPPGNILVLAMAQTFSNVFNVYNVMALDEFQESDITHWMPLPDAPQEPTND